MANLVVSVKNFGPIVEGEVELKPFTVFIGPNNTGKSYLAVLIHTFLESLSSYSYYPIPISIKNRGREILVIRRGFIKDRFGVFFSDEIETRLLNEIISINTSIKQDYFSDGLTKDVFKSFKNHIEKDFTEYFKENLERNFGCDISDLNHNSEPFELIFKINKLEFYYKFLKKSELESSITFPLKKIKYKITPDRRILSFGSERDDEIIISLSKGLMDLFKKTSKEDDDYDYLAGSITREIAQTILQSFFPETIKNSYYLPAARSGILSGHKAIASGAIREIPMIGIRGINIPSLLTGIVADFLANIVQIQKRPVSFKRLVNFIEKNIIGGRVDLKEIERYVYPDIHYYFNDLDLPLHMSSSMVQELAPIILYLKYVMSKESNLIIEEPESHLHPAAQRVFAKALIRLVNNGVNLIITSHSDYLLKQIQNIYLISQMGREFAKKLNYKQKEMLAEDSLNVYLFNAIKGLGTTKIEEIDLTDTSIYKSGFHKIIDALYEESVIINRELLRREAKNGNL